MDTPPKKKMYKEIMSSKKSMVRKQKVKLTKVRPFMEDFLRYIFVFCFFLNSRLISIPDTYIVMVIYIHYIYICMYTCVFLYIYTHLHLGSSKGEGQHRVNVDHYIVDQVFFLVG